MKTFQLTAVFILLTLHANAADRFVDNLQDVEGQWALRTILRYACDEAGDDVIYFRKPATGNAFNLMMTAPLVIPEDCDGKITLDGSLFDVRDQPVSGETILDYTYVRGQVQCDASEEDCLYPVPGSERERLIQEQAGGLMHGDSCILHVYSKGHTIQNITFVGNEFGAGVCLFAPSNQVQNNRFGKTATGRENPNRYGIVVHNVFSFNGYPTMNGSQNIISHNAIGPSTQHGLWIHANNATITNNEISYSQNNSGIILFGNEHELKDNTVLKNKGQGIYVNGEGSTFAHNTIQYNNQYGIYVAAPSHNLMIGGPTFEADHNSIQNNEGGGIALEWDQAMDEITITHNIISNNVSLALDLGNNGITQNDDDDTDEGPNHFLNFIDYLQVFPLGHDASSPIYWAWGIAKNGTRLEAYSVSEADIQNPISHGGGNSWLQDINPSQHTFEISPQALEEVENGGQITLLSFDENGNTSEFAPNAFVGNDEDLDGIPDLLEGGRGNPQSADSDGDGLPDPAEDRNRNGVWDRNLGETRTDNADTDHDGLSDWAETHGDGLFDEGVDTNPLSPDTDHDGLSDGQEDANGNGIIDGYLRETSPLLPDSDGDNISDDADVCPTVTNYGQESWYCS